MEGIYFFILYFFVYGFLGWCTEVAFAAWKEHRFVNRGFLNGPICPIYGIGVGVVAQFLTPYKSNLVLLYIASVILVTALEWVTGFVLEKVFHNKWWDYSNMPLNLNGYVCLLFSLVWGVACVLIVDFVHPLIHAGLSHIPWVLGIILIVLFGGVTIADLIVTSSGILKLNRRLAKMHTIAAELHSISEKLGENIYKSTISAVEKSEEVSENVSSEFNERVEELKKRYKAAGENTTRIQKRLINAFPKMENRKYSEAFNELRAKLKDLDKTLRKK